MTPSKLLITLAIGLTAAACQASTTQTVMAPAGFTGSEQTCVDYGFTPGTGGFDRCVSREREARARGRVMRGYAESQMTADARDACYSYGLEPGTPRYDRCVGREIDARQYRDTAAVVSSTSAYSPSYGTTVVYTQTTPVQPYMPPVQTPPAGVQASRDEYGFRYDGQGNRIDARGNIISPQSTQP
jgi:hypothetical protein